MTRTHVTIAGGALLLLGAVFAGVSLAKGSTQEHAAEGPAWDFPLPPVHGPGYTSLEGVVPNGPWPHIETALRGPSQPIFYRHDIHAGQYRIPCLYCHNNAANSWTANIPSVQTCMGCHTVVSAADSAGTPHPEIQRLRDYAAQSDSAIEWVRIYKISEHARFPHMRHVNARIACQECHGNVQQQPQVWQVRDVNNMGWCTNCHMRRGITRDCTACHF